MAAASTFLLNTPATFLIEFNYLVKLLKIASQVQVNVNADLKTPELKSSTSVVQGFKPVCKALCLSSSSSLNRLLGQGVFEYAKVEDKLDLISSLEKKSLIKSLDTYLNESTFLADTPTVSLVDALAYVRIYSDFKKQAEDMEKFVLGHTNLVRWFNTVQTDLSVAPDFSIIPFNIVELTKTLTLNNVAAAAKEDPAVKGESEVPGEGKKKAKKAEPKAAKAKPAAAAETEEDCPNISKLDIRIGRIVSVKKHDSADTLYVEQIDVGEGEPRTIVSGLVNHVPIEQMEGRLLLVLCNLKPASMRGVVSQGMVLCASTEDKSKVEILVPPAGSKPGDVVEFEGFPHKPLPQLNPKKKIFEDVKPNLKTNDSLIATFEGKRMLVRGIETPVTTASLKNAFIS